MRHVQVHNWNNNQAHFIFVLCCHISMIKAKLERQLSKSQSSSDLCPSRIMLRSIFMVVVLHKKRSLQSPDFFLNPYAYYHAESQQASIPTIGCLDGVHLRMEWYAHANEYCLSSLSYSYLPIFGFLYCC
jgi:hypothetical protein